MASPKQLDLDKIIIKGLSGKILGLAEILINDKEIEILQDHANNVSIKRLNYNDHGPVHMRKVAYNALKMIRILSDKGIRFDLEKEKIGNVEDSTIAVFTAAFLHDVGMCIGRDGHERMTVTLTDRIIERILFLIYPDDMKKRLIVRSTVYEGIIGHMGTQKIHSLEAGTVLVADGCDMEKGRARIPLIAGSVSKVGDIHKYSSAAIERVYITEGNDKPLRIQVEMTESAGFFQVEEILMKKISMSPLKKHIELYAGVVGKDLKRYL